MTDERKKELRELADEDYDWGQEVCDLVEYLHQCRDSIPELLDHIEELEAKIERQRLRYTELTETVEREKRVLKECLQIEWRMWNSIHAQECKYDGSTDAKKHAWNRVRDFERIAGRLGISLEDGES